jgi:hypothetical protein
MDKALIAKRVADRLFATEKAVDSAILEASQLLSGLIEARQQMNLNAVLGSETMTKLSLALTALNEAREHVAETHTGLAEVQLRLGIRTRLDGGIGPKSHHRDVVSDVDQRRVG